MKYALVLGGGGFIGGHLSRRLLKEGFHVTIADVKPHHDFWDSSDICSEYLNGDLRDPVFVKSVMKPRNDRGYDEVYQLAADMGAGYIFTGENDANVMHNSALINLNVVHEAAKSDVKNIFYSSSACMYQSITRLNLIIRIVKKVLRTLLILTLNMDGRSYSVKGYS